MERTTTKPAVAHSGGETNAQLFEDWFDPIEAGVREQVRNFIESMIETELEEALSRPRYGRLANAGGSSSEGPSGLGGHRHTAIGRGQAIGVTEYPRDLLNHAEPSDW